MTHFWSKKESLLYFIKKLKNKTEQQLKQAFHAAFIFYEINNTDQDKIQILKNKKANISTKNQIVLIGGLSIKIGTILLKH